MTKDPDILALPTEDGFRLVRYDAILFCKANGRFTSVNLREGAEQILVKKSMKSVEAALPDKRFLRIHHSYLVNMQHLQSWQRKGEYLELEGGVRLQLARSKKKLLIERLNFIEKP